MALLNALASGAIFYGFFTFLVIMVRFIILLSFLIPISVKLFVMIGRFGFSQKIMTDKEIEGTVVKTETIVDELGKIEVILSDKTGTITQNIMEMEKINLEETIMSST